MKKFFNYLILSLIICLSMSATSVMKTKFLDSPPPAPIINGNHCFTFSTTVTTGGGQIVAAAGTTVTVTVTASTSSATYLRIIAFRFTDGTDYISVNSSSTSKSFIMPGGGYVNWGGSFSTSNNGSGSACVQ